MEQGESRILEWTSLAARQALMLQVLEHFLIISDPPAANARHELSEIMFIALQRR